MAFIPDPFSATVRIGARWRGGQLVSLDDQPLPEIHDGTLIELIVPRSALTNEQDVAKFTTKKTVQFLPVKSGVLLGLSLFAVSEEEWSKFVRPEKASAASSYLLAEVGLLEPLRITIDGNQRATLEACRCHVPLLGTDARSLNHALTLLSLRFEPARMSHGGNVFRQGFIRKSNGWLSLDALRLSKVAEFLADTPETKQTL